ncbi:MAG: phage holin family protein [Alphaproteobacteria bacterium]
MGDRSLPELMRDLIEQVGNLVRDEVRLARAETSEKLNIVKAAAGLLAGALAFAIGGIVIVLFAAAAALGQYMDAWLASLIVGVAALAVAAILVSVAKSQMTARELAPSRTAQSVRTDAQFLKEKVQ